MKNDKHPLLSICIPTFNRGEILEQTIRSYLNNKEFDDTVEIIISDNASTDNTQEICKSFIQENKNIKYYRNKENIRERNFICVLNYATGEYLKLTNDWICADEKSLRYIKATIRENIKQRKPIFFTNDYIYTKKKNSIIECENLDHYVQAISTFVTSSNCFGVWKEQWDNIKNKDKYIYTMLPHVDWSYQIVAQHNGCILYDTTILFPIGVNKLGKRSGYNWFQIHLDYYYRIMQPYVENKYITSQTLKQDKLYLLEHFKSELIKIYTLIPKQNWQFDTKRTFKYLWKYYYNIPIFYFYILTYPFWGSYFSIKYILRKILPPSFINKIKKLYK